MSGLVRGERRVSVCSDAVAERLRIECDVVTRGIGCCVVVVFTFTILRRHS
jgi:hypothetical protein